MMYSIALKEHERFFLFKNIKLNLYERVRNKQNLQRNNNISYNVS